MTQTIVKLNMEAALEPQLENAPRNAEKLNLHQDVPTNDQWALLSKHFTSVKDLHVDSGWNEDLNDRDIPLHWPLEKLTYTSACGQVCQSPWILEGRVPHLVLNYTSGLRFEGPTNDELTGRRFMDFGNREQQGPPPKADGMTITYIPDLAADWMRKKHTNAEGDKPDGPEATTQDSSDDTTKAAPASQLKTLEIIHNDVRDTLSRYVLAHPGLLDPIQTLSLIAIDPNDLNEGDGDVLEQVLPQLARLTTLVLVLGDHHPDRAQLPNLFRSLPPNVETLRFRSSVSLAKDDVVAGWVEAFRDPAFLPRLKRLSVALDLDDGEAARLRSEEGKRRFVQMIRDRDAAAKRDFEARGGDAAPSCPSEGSIDDSYALGDEQEPMDGEECSPEDSVVDSEDGSLASGQMAPSNVSDEALALAKRACERVERAAESRGVVIESFMGEWREGFTSLTSLDERWDKL